MHVAALALALVAAPQTWAGERSRAAVATFKRLHPCPLTNQPRSACPGLVVDHVIPLCAGGPDTPENMQWQTVEEAKAKDIEERRQCARTRQ